MSAAAKLPETTSVEDSVPRVGNELAVGEDLEFQRRWWRFERIIWILFLCILVCDMLGLFGRGWLARAQRSTPDKALTLDYERFERASTPSIMTLKFGPDAVKDGNIQVYVSDDVVKWLGAQRVSPQPAVSHVGSGGITYTFAAGPAPATVQIELEPSFPGLHRFRVQLRDSSPIEGDVFVFP
jgi:hypothetical protein